MRPLRLAFLSLCWALLPLSAAQAATDYPARPIELVIPYPAGGPNDVIGRALGDQMSKELGQTVVIKNQPGAGGNVATASVSRAKPDGYTLVLTGMAFAVNPSIFKETNYEMEDFDAVSIVVQGPQVLVVHPSAGINSVAELVERAKKEPGALEYASGGVGSSLHLAAELFKHDADVDILHVPYKGTGDLMPDVLAGRVDILFSSPLTVRQHVDAGRLIALGVTGNQEVKGWEGIPPISETVPGYEMFAWYSLMAPAGVPEDILDKLNAVVLKAQQSPEFIQQMDTLGMEIVETTRPEAKSYIDQEFEKWAKLIDVADITTD